jgi:hypothetical protein
MPFRHIDRKTFTPEALNVIYAAFDLAWADVAGDFGTDPTRIEFGRNALAQAVLAAAEGGGKDAQALKDAALAAF